MTEPSKRTRDVAHAWWDKRITRTLRKKLPKAEYKLARDVYLALCEIDSDFRDQINYIKTNLHNLTKTCATYSGSDKDVVTKYLKFLREVGFVDYGMRRNEKGQNIGTFLILYKFTQIPVHRVLGKKSLIQNPVQPDSAPSGSFKNDINIKFCKSFSKEKHMHVSTKRVKLPKFIISDNGNKDSSVDEQSPIQLLGDWLDYDIPVLPYNKPVINLRTKLFEKKTRPSARLVKSILDYWNEIATALKLNGWKVPLHYIKNNKTTFLCQLIVTGLSKINGYTEKEIKNAIDNHAIIMDNSNWYRKSNGQKPYNFIQFFSNQKLFEDCITDNIKGNSRYFNVKGGNGTSLATILEKKVKQYSKSNYGREPEGEELKYIKQEAWNEHDKILENRGIPKEQRKELLMKEWKEINHAG